MHGLPVPEAILKLMSCNSVSACRVQMNSGVLTCVKSKLATTRLRSLIQMIKLCQMTLKNIRNNLDFSSKYLACIIRIVKGIVRYSTR